MIAEGFILILVLAPIGCAAWLAMLSLMFRTLGIKPKELLDEITLPEAVLVGSLAFSAAIVVAELFARFV